MILLRYKQVLNRFALEAQLGHRRCTAVVLTFVAFISVVTVTLDYRRLIGLFLPLIYLCLCRLVRLFLFLYVIFIFIGYGVQRQRLYEVWQY